MKLIFKITIAFSILMIIAGTSFAKVEKLEDLKSATVGVLEGSVSEKTIGEMLGDRAEEYMITYDFYSDMVEGLRDGEIEAAIMDEAPARYFAVNESGLKILPEALENDLYGIAFKKGSPLVNDVNKIIAEMKEDGSLIAIIAKYLEENPDSEKIDMNKDAKNGKLWVGCSAFFPPYEMRSADGFAGIDIELCAAIAKKLDKELVIADYRFSVLPEALEAGKIDMICSAFIISEERKKTMDFSEPYDANQEVVVVLE